MDDCDKGKNADERRREGAQQQHIHGVLWTSRYAECHTASAHNGHVCVLGAVWDRISMGDSGPAFVRREEKCSWYWVFAQWNRKLLWVYIFRLLLFFSVYLAFVYGPRKPFFPISGVAAAATFAHRAHPIHRPRISFNRLLPGLPLAITSHSGRPGSPICSQGVYISISKSASFCSCGSRTANARMPPAFQQLCNLGYVCMRTISVDTLLDLQITFCFDLLGFYGPIPHELMNHKKEFCTLFAVFFRPSLHTHKHKFTSSFPFA